MSKENFIQDTQCTHLMRVLTVWVQGIHNESNNMHTQKHPHTEKQRWYLPPQDNNPKFKFFTVQGELIFHKLSFSIIMIQKRDPPPKKKKAEQKEKTFEVLFEVCVSFMGFPGSSKQ